VVKACFPDPKCTPAVIPFDLPLLKVHATARPDYPSHHYKAWQLLWNNRASGKLGIGLTPAYLDEGLNEVFYQLDIFLWPLLPSMAANRRRLWHLLNISTRNRVLTDTSIVCIAKKIVSPLNAFTLKPEINPPLFSWIEPSYYCITGDISRLARMFPKLNAYYSWLEKNTRS
jgi:hypothetical protein